MTFLLGAVGGAICGALVVYCSNSKGRRGKQDLTPAGPQCKDVTCPTSPAPLYQDVGAPRVAPAPPPATAAALYEDMLVPQLELKENIAYGKVETI